VTEESVAMPEAARRTRPVIDVALVASNLPFVVRTAFGIAVLAVGANIAGVGVVTFVIATINARSDQHQVTVLIGTGIGLVLLSVITGVTSAVIIQRRTLHWLLRGERPSTGDAQRAVHLPRDMAVIAATHWLAGAIVISALAAAIGEDHDTVGGIAGGIVLAGLTSAGVTYLIVGRVSQPIARLALASCPPASVPVLGIRWQLMLIWLLTSGAPVLGIVLVLTAPRGKTHIVRTSLFVALAALIVGALATSLAARAIGQPLRGVVDAMRQVGAGNLDLALDIEDSGEIGLVQAGFNEMVAGLRERDRVTDLFGRHVGSSVAREALRSGITLSGELRDVVALFVDITGSTERSRRTDPTEFVAMLNRFFEVVVEEVERGGGLLNKFEGDAALCVFGAPVELIDAASGALRAARTIRDRVFAMAEVEVGIGVAAGEVVAGQVGTQSRLEYTVIGDPVNEAARLTDLAKDRRQHVLASAAVIGRANSTERAHWERVGEVQLRGRDVPTEVWTA
jgi:adenylate cyclase